MMDQKGCYTYDYPRPALTTDCVIFGYDGTRLKVLLIERANEPFKGKWAFPGGFVDMDETTETCAHRELEEETGLKDIDIEQLYTFSDVNRDPRGRTVSVTYLALIPIVGHEVKGSDDAAQARWFSTNELPSLAFDHDQILQMALQRLKTKFKCQSIGIEPITKHFTIKELENLCESIQ